MYFCVLNILIFSQDPILERIARGIAPLEHFEHSIQVFHSGFQPGQALENGDIIIWNLPQEMGLGKLRSQLKDNASLIICDTASNFASLEEDLFLSAADLWEVPLDQRLIAFRFRKLLAQRKLRKDHYLNSTYLDTLIDSLPDMVWFKDLEGRHLKVNRTFCHTVEKTREDVTGRDHCYIWNVSPNDPDSGEQACKRSEEIVIQQRKTCQFTEVVKSQGSKRQFITYKSPLFDEDGAIMGTVGMGHDITALENLGTEMEILLRSMPFAILISNEKGIITNVNDRFEHYFGISKNEVIGKAYAQWILAALEPNKTVNSEGFIEAVVKDSIPARTLELHEEAIYDVFQNVVGQLCIYRDITIVRKLEKQILHNSNTDFLTGLYNRRCFYQYIYNNRKEKTISLLYVDLDCFKKVNDTYGHQIGDKALICTADLLRECFGNEFIARIGGDEFLIAILGECSIASLETRAQKMLDRMIQVFQSIPQYALMSASIGIAQTSDPSLDIDLLIQESDTALYEAKKQGKGRFCVYRPARSEKREEAYSGNRHRFE